MKSLLARIVIATALIAISLCADEIVLSASAQHALSQGPAQVRSEFDNDAMMVLRIRMAPHEKTGMHELTPRLVIWLTDAHLRDTKPDGTVTDYRRAAGATEWVPAQRHAGENLSDTPIEFLAVLPKSSVQAGEHHAPH
jgi:hypothetical protein